MKFVETQSPDPALATKTAMIVSGLLKYPRTEQTE